MESEITKAECMQLLNDLIATVDEYDNSLKSDCQGTGMEVIGQRGHILFTGDSDIDKFYALVSESGSEATSKDIDGGQYHSFVYSGHRFSIVTD